MKKFFGTMIVLFSAMLGITSCLDDASSEATVEYFVNIDSIEYTDSTDAQYDSLICVAAKDLAIAYYNFKETAKSDVSISAYAVALCNEKACKTFETNTKRQTITLRQIEDQMYKTESSKFQQKGIHSGAEIGLHPLTLDLVMYAFDAGWTPIVGAKYKIEK